jgi:hypothetical protein
MVKYQHEMTKDDLIAMNQREGVKKILYIQLCWMALNAVPFANRVLICLRRNEIILQNGVLSNKEE